MTTAETINAAILLATIVAILVGPVVAVFITRRIDDKREEARRRLETYRILMLTRAARMAPDHVRALNLVPADFAKDEAVIEEFRKYIDHLNSPFPAVEQQPHFFEQRNDIFFEMLFRIGQALGYRFDKRDLERLSYIPQGMVDDEQRQRQTQMLLAEVLEGKRTFPVAIGQITQGKSPFPPAPT